MASDIFERGGAPVVTRVVTMRLPAYAPAKVRDEDSVIEIV